MIIMVMIPWATRVLIILCCGIALLWLTGCGGEVEQQEASSSNQSAKELYQEAQLLFSGGSYKSAIKAFEEVEQQYPYSPLASRAQIMAAYSAYRGQEYEEAVLISERYVKLHPTGRSAPYAYYLRALSYYDQITDVGRDQGITSQARQALREVVARYPNSEYAQDAQLKLDLTEDHLAGKEMEIGRYYLQRQEYVAAIGRFRSVAEGYQTTSHIPEALHRLVETYTILGLPDEAEKYAAVLGYNYPGSKWYRFSYKLLKGEPVAERAADDDSWYAIF